MYSRQVELKFDGESRNRAGAFRIKRSKTKRSNHKNQDLLSSSGDRTTKHEFERRSKEIEKNSKRQHKFNSEKIKKKLKLIEDYFYPE